MILGRLSLALRQQNWLAVGIEFLIVTAGVFLGIQFGNWNDARVADARQARYLERLQDDFEIIRNGLVRERQRSERFNALSSELRDWLADDADLVGRVTDEHIDALMSASRPPRPSPTYLEMQASGAFSRIDRQGLRTALISYHLHTEVAERGLEWALAGFDPERAAFAMLGRPEPDYDLLRRSYREVSYMALAHALQIEYADAGMELAEAVLSELSKAMP